jgi:GIY-YIG catalytic domain
MALPLYGTSYTVSMPARVSSPCVYRFYSQEGRLLYVGSTKAFTRRMADHRNGAVVAELLPYYAPGTLHETPRGKLRGPRPWWQQGQCVEVEECETVEEARERERQAIVSEKPWYNVVWPHEKGGWRRVRPQPIQPGSGGFHLRGY